MKKTVYIGMDVHLTNYTLNSDTCGADNCFSTVKLGPYVKNILKCISWIKKDHGDDIEIITGYEACCLGDTLYKSLEIDSSIRRSDARYTGQKVFHNFH